MKSLYVDIEKKCGDFNLKVKFETTSEVFAILGASGCGKSLTLKCIAGIETPDRGVIILNGRTLFDSEKRINVPARKRRAGYMFQDYALFPNMTVLENIMCGTRNKEEAVELIKRFCLTGKEKLYPHQLSGGQKQRTAIARMLGSRPEVVLLDEPFSALDNHLKTRLEREVMDTFEKFDNPVLFVSHDRNEVYRLTDRIAVMENGSVIDIQGKRELFDNPLTLAATLLTGCKNITRLKDNGDGTYFAEDWGINLKTKKGCANAKYAGFRAHYFEITEAMEESNVIECEVIRVIEDTFSYSILFKNKNYENDGENGILTYELSKDEYEKINKGKLFLKIPRDKLILMER